MCLELEGSYGAGCGGVECSTSGGQLKGLADASAMGVARLSCWGVSGQQLQSSFLSIYRSQLHASLKRPSAVGSGLSSTGGDLSEAPWRRELVRGVALGCSSGRSSWYGGRLHGSCLEQWSAGAL